MDSSSSPSKRVSTLWRGTGWTVEEFGSTGGENRGLFCTDCSGRKVDVNCGREGCQRRGDSIIWLVGVIFYQCKKRIQGVHQLADLSWVDLDLGCSIILPNCSAFSAQIPSAHPESADSGTPKIKVKPTKVCEVMDHPVMLPFHSVEQA